MDIVQILATEFSIAPWQVKNTMELLEEGNTIPFIARYRKEKTGELKDVLLRDLDERLKYLQNLAEKKLDIEKKIREQEKWTPELAKAVDEATTMQTLEDLYAPYRPKKRTRAVIARERGLEPLSKIILEEFLSTEELENRAESFITEEVSDVEEALNGAKDILAEDIADTAEYREILRNDGKKNGILSVKASGKEELGVYAMYEDYEEAYKDIVNHRILAMNRGEKEDVLRVSLKFRDEECIKRITRRMAVNHPKGCTFLYEEIVMDSLQRLMKARMETELRNELTLRAQEDAIDVFGLNLRNYLMQSPLRGKVVLGIDPGYRTGCKVAVVDENSNLLDYTTIYPTKPQEKISESKAILTDLVKKYKVNLFAIGNGTASRETEQLVADLVKESKDLQYAVVNEAGASIYSASKLGNEEFPDLDVSIRGAISIARRIQDPLAELVKIEPWHIGVGQYQHDLNQKRLEEALSGVVEDCVNTVGVDVATASVSLLTYVSGINGRIAENILKYQRENGEIKSREELKKIKGIGAKTFEQCAGFLRIVGPEPLDNTAVHPESYSIARVLMEEKDQPIKKLAEQLSVGEITLRAIKEELAKKGRDIREAVGEPILRKDVLSMEDLSVGMKLRGTVRNVVDFGCFVDIGVKQDGLVHISKISRKFIKHPKEAVKVGDIVEVTVIEVDLKRNRISLSMVEK